MGIFNYAGIIVFLSSTFLFEEVKSLNYVPFDNSCYDVNNCDATRCMINCRSCDTPDICTTCRYGYFLYHSPNSTVECVPCPYVSNWENPFQFQGTLKCAQCIENPMNWEKTRYCQKAFILETGPSPNNLQFLKELDYEGQQPQVYRVMYNGKIDTPKLTKYQIKKAVGCLDLFVAPVAENDTGASLFDTGEPEISIPSDGQQSGVIDVVSAAANTPVPKPSGD